MNKNIFFALIFTAFLGACCKKAKPLSVIGFWKGEATLVGTVANSPQFYLFSDNGSLRYYLGTDTATAKIGIGTYQLNGTTLTMNYSIPSIGGNGNYSETCFVNTSGTHFDGNWIDANATFNRGVTYADKQ